MKKVLAILLTGAMAVSMLAGCGSSSSDTTTAAGGEATTTAAASTSEAATLPEITETTADPSDIEFEPFELVVGSINDVGNMYPGGALMTGRKSMHNLVYEPLFWADPDSGELVPIIGKEYTEKGDGTYEIEIFDYVTDSAGNNITAEDVCFCIGKYIEDGQNSSIYSSITDYHATGDYTLEVTFAPESVGQFSAFATYIYIYSEKAYEDSGDGFTSVPCATGGYTLDVDNTITGSVYVFDKRDDYWQTDEEYICDRNTHNPTKVTIKVITDASTLAMELQNGGVDFVADIAAADRGNFMDDNGALDGYTISYGANNAYVHLSFNCSENSPCGDENLRKAIAYAIDAAACAQTAHGSVGQACKMASNPNLYDVTEDMEDPDYFTYEEDCATAKEYLEKSSYNGETIRILVQPNTVIKAAAPLIKAYLAYIGINVETLEYDMPQYRSLEADTTGTEYDIKLNGLQATDDYVCKSLQEVDNTVKGTGLNQLYINDPELQELYEAAAGVDTTSEEAVKELLDYVEEHCYIYGLYYGPKVYIGKSSIKYMNSSIPEDNLFGAFIMVNE